MAKWIDELFSLNKTAEQTNAQQEFTKKIKAGGWAEGVMEISEEGLKKEAEQKIEAELKVRDELVKEAAYEAFQTDEEVLNQDFARDAAILSDYQLSEWLAEYRARAENIPFPENASELKEKAKKDVASDRKGCEKELIKLVGQNTLLDWQKNFKKFSEFTNEQPKESDLYKPALKDVNDDLSKGAKVDEYALTDEQHAKTTQGLGREQDQRTDVTEQAGEVKNEALGKISEKTAALVRDPDVEIHIGTLIRLARSIMDHEGVILAEGTLWEVTGADASHYIISANGEKHTISSHDTPKFDTIKKNASQTEIENHATKEQVLEKIAEIKSPWAVVEKDGQEVIARISDEQGTNKESEEEKTNLNK